MLLNYDKIINRFMKLASFVWMSIVVPASLSLASTSSADSGPLVIENMVCEGDTKTSCDFIIEQSALKVGEEVDDEKMHDIRMKMQLLGYFDEIDIRLSKGSSRGKALVTFAIKEHSMISSNVTAGLIKMDTMGGLVDAAVIDRNITGNGDSLELRARVSGVTLLGYFGHESTQSYRIRSEYNRKFVDSKYFLKTGLNYSHSLANSSSGYNYANDAGWLDLAVGRKIFEHSFLVVGTRGFFAYSSTDYSKYEVNPFLQYSLSPGLLNHAGFYFQYGWDSQDDANFPTQGSKFIASLDYLPGVSGGTSYFINVGYRKHWELAPTQVLTLNLGGITQNNDVTYPLLEQSSLGLRYSKQFRRHAAGADIQNGAYYIEPGFYARGDSVSLGGYYSQTLGAKVGTNFQTSFGIVNLFFLATI
jgi:outer membrane protein assembly factor BamA